MTTHVEFRNGKAIMSIEDYEALVGTSAKDVVESNAQEAEADQASFPEPWAVEAKRVEEQEEPEVTQNGRTPSATRKGKRGKVEGDDIPQSDNDVSKDLPKEAPNPELGQV